MDDDGPNTNDISQLWGADAGAVWEPAPLRRPEPRPGSRHADRLQAIEHDLRTMMETVERVEFLVNERLSQLEQQVAELTSRLAMTESKPRRLSGVIKTTRSH